MDSLSLISPPTPVVFEVSRAFSVGERSRGTRPAIWKDLGLSPHLGSQGVTVTGRQALAQRFAKSIQEHRREKNPLQDAGCWVMGLGGFLVYPAPDSKSQKRAIRDVGAAEGEMGRLART